MTATARSSPAPILSATVSPASRKLVTLEAGRFFAATIVMLYHYTGVVADFSGHVILSDIFRPGHVGVPYFFVLSGFIIYHVHRNDLGRPALLPLFAVKRAIRLYPLFLAISAVMLAGFLVKPGLAGGRDLSPGGLVADFLLLPRADAVLSISWTLRHEMIFYALFMLALLWGGRALWLVGLWGVASLILSMLAEHPSLGFGSLIASPLNIGFAFGMVVAWIAPRPALLPPKLCIGVAFLTLALLWGLEWSLGQGVAHDVVVLGTMGDIAYLTAATLLVYGLVQQERHWQMPGERLFGILGGASYALYLVHQPVASLALRAFPTLLRMPPLATFAILALLALTMAVSIHLTFERWILGRLTPFARRFKP